MPPEGHLRGAGPPTSCDAAVGVTASLSSAARDTQERACAPAGWTVQAARPACTVAVSHHLRADASLV
eukprot:scaffold3266_cov53-Phaeocystis_antarctica.AAC.1